MSKKHKYQRQKRPKQRVSISRWAKNDKQWLKDVEFTQAETGRGWRNTPEYREWRDAVLERDGHACIVCGTEEHLECHHKIPASIAPELRYEIRNGETLCRKHHEITPHQYKSEFWRKMIDE